MDPSKMSAGSARVRWSAPALLVCALCAVAQTRSSAPAVRACKAQDLSLGTDGENGAFNGMSHSGTLLVLRNLSSSACSVPAFPQVDFLDGSRSLNLRREVPGGRFMHPGPVVLPVTVAPEAEVTSKLRWVSGEVYDKSVCVAPTAVAVTLPGGRQQVAMTAHICGDATKGVTYQATPMVADPRP